MTHFEAVDLRLYVVRSFVATREGACSVCGLPGHLGGLMNVPGVLGRFCCIECVECHLFGPGKCRYATKKISPVALTRGASSHDHPVRAASQGRTAGSPVSPGYALRRRGDPLSCLSKTRSNIAVEPAVLPCRLPPPLPSIEKLGQPHTELCALRA